MSRFRGFVFSKPYKLFYNGKGFKESNFSMTFFRGVFRGRFINSISLPNDRHSISKLAQNNITEVLSCNLQCSLV